MIAFSPFYQQPCGPFPSLALCSMRLFADHCRVATSIFSLDSPFPFIGVFSLSPPPHPSPLFPDRKPFARFIGQQEKNELDCAKGKTLRSMLAAKELLSLFWAL